MRYPQHLVNDYFKERKIAPTYYWVTVWIQSIVYHDVMSRRYASSFMRPLKWGVRWVQPRYMGVRKFFRDDHLWEISFIRKEKVYTKLKYSRSPSYDIASAGIAALFAGLLSFLICEKFGFEMVDGGDFLFAWLYVIGFVFSCKTLLNILHAKQPLITLCRGGVVWVRFWVSRLYPSYNETQIDEDQ